MLDRLVAADMEAHLGGEDEEQARRFGWWPKRSGPEHFRAFLEADEREWETGGSRRRFATRVDGALVGGCELRLGDADRAEVSYWTFPPFRGRGYTTRAARLVASWALGELGVECVELRIERDNHPSRRVAARAGFVETGRATSDGLFVYERTRVGSNSSST